MIDKIIFLDVDGVINSDEFARWCHQNRDFLKERKIKSLYYITVAEIKI